MADQAPAPAAWLVEQSGAAALRGVHCTKCGAFAFPAQAFGCIRCGAFGDQLQPQTVPTNGTLVTFAIVRTHASHPVPFTLADVQLDAGPVVRGQLAASAPLQLGARVVATVVDDTDPPHLEFIAETSP